MQGFGIIESSLPEAERENARAISMNLRSLETLIKNFNSALHLIDHAEGLHLPQPTVTKPKDYLAQKPWERIDQNQIYIDWRFIAARSGAITLHEFSELLAAIDELRKLCPVLNSYISDTAFDAAVSLFELSFPNFHPVRVFAAHGADMTMRPDQVRRHLALNVNIDGAISAKGNVSVLLSNNLVGRKLVSTFGPKKTEGEAQVVSYDLTLESLEKLNQVLESVESSFTELVEITLVYTHPDKTGPVPLRE